MSEWWTYRPSDFVMISPRTWWRLLEAHNLAWWPLQGLTLGLGLLVLVTVWRRPGPAAGLLLALAWGFVAWAFHAQRYASVHLAANGFAAAFVLQGGLLLAWSGLSTRQPPAAATAPGRRRSGLGLGLMAAALLAHPLLALLDGRGLAQSELLGLMPDPTVLFTLGLLVCAAPSTGQTGPQRWLWLLCWPLPLAWSVGSGLSLWTLHAPEAALLPLAAALALVAATRQTTGSRASPAGDSP